MHAYSNYIAFQLPNVQFTAYATAPLRIAKPFAAYKCTRSHKPYVFARDCTLM
uniref:Bifunctional protein FolD 2 isoform X2 n=1 Tax=Rhizophora mucronata TaxID=61149 RepID=A0A2P2JXI8_RHIMU